MSICFCGTTAERILDLIALKRLSSYGCAGHEAFDGCSSGRKELREALRILPELDKPIHLLVPRSSLRVRTDEARPHVWRGPVPYGSLLYLAPGILTASPEFNALLEMRGASLVERTLTLMRYCGIFAIDESSEDGFVKRPQLATVERLRSLALQEQRQFSSRNLLEASELAIERARSPFEARLALVLTIPSEMGGFGIPRPELNKPIDIGDEGFAILGRRSVEGDLVWLGKRIVVEANGRLRHEGRFGDDLTRASALEANGFSVRFVTAQQLRSPRQMSILAGWLMERLGIKTPMPDPDKLRELLNEIMSFKFCNTSHSSLGAIDF